MDEKTSALIARLQTASRNGSSLLAELCGQAAAELLKQRTEIEWLRNRLEECEGLPAIRLAKDRT